MNLLIIGGSGFVGKSFIDGFNRGILKKFNLNKIYILSRKPSVLKKYKKLNLKNIKLIKGDIRHIKKLPNCKIIIFAADTSDTTYYKNKKKNFNFFVKLIDNFCNVIKQRKKTKVLYLSSGSVYGNYPTHIKRISEKYNCKINHNVSNYKNMYSKIKLYSESKISDLCQSGLSTSIARCFSFVGPWLPTNQRYAIGNFILDGFKNNNINVKSKHKVIRSYMYVDDLVYWLVKIAINSNKKCPIYNVGSDEGVSLEILAKTIGEIFKKPVKTRKIKNQRIDNYVPNIGKAKKALNLRINYDLKRSILSTIQYS